MFTVFTDTSANLPASLAKSKKIRIIPFSFFVDESEHICHDLDHFESNHFFNMMRSGTHITTSQIPPQRYIDHLEPVLQEGSDILFIGLSSGVSGSYNAAEIAAELLLSKYPQRHIRLIDSLGASLGEGLLALKAAECRDEHFSLDETADLVLDLRARMCQIFTVDDLNHLKRSGRLSNISATFGTLLNIKPLLKGDENGKIVSFDKVRGRKRSIAAIAEKYDKLIVNAATQTIGIAHADCPKDAEYLISLLRRNHPPKDILCVCYEPVTGSHVGPGTLALFFSGDHTVRYQQ